jgi:hypothetical protein
MKNGNNKVDVTIAIGHSGLDRDKRIANAVGSDLDLLVGAHSHTLMWNDAEQGEWPRSTANPNLRGPTSTYPIIQNDVAIVHAASDSRYLGGIDIVIEDAEDGIGAPTIVFSPIQAFLRADDVNEDGSVNVKGISEDPEAVAIIDRLEVDVGAWRASVVGNVTKALGNSLDSSSEFGGLVCDAMIHDAKVTYDMDVDFAVFPSGHMLGDGLPAGGLNFSEVAQLFPVGLSTSVVQVTGRELFAILEHGVANLPNNTQGEFLQVGGLTFTFQRIETSECGLGLDFARPCNRFSKIRRVQTILNKRSEVIRPDDGLLFRLAITNRLLEKAYDYKILSEVPALLTTGSPVDIVVFNYLKSIKGEYVAGQRAVDETPDWLESGVVPKNFPMGIAFIVAVVICGVVMAYVCVYTKTQDAVRYHAAKDEVD